MKITVSWLETAPVKRVMEMFSASGHEAYFVGGCVRNALLQEPVSDLDISTPILPETVMQIAQDAGLKAVPTGLDHGTVTVVVEGEPFEITTFRKDVATDGRRAVVTFSTKIEEDARRRDFTMNALYADKEGHLIDPLNGFDDLENRRVRFIDDPDRRIEEDYLRILRFFRFFAWYGDRDAGPDAEAIAACAKHVSGLEGLSRERVGVEILKLLAAPDPSQALGAMDQTGVLNAVLPGAHTRAFFVLTSLERDIDPLMRLAALGDFDVSTLLRLSKSQAREFAILRSYVGSGAGLAEIAYREDAATAGRIACLRAAVFEHPLGNVSEDIHRGAEAKFPISAQDLMPKLTGPELGAMLKQLEKSWIESGFRADREALLKQAGGL